MRAIFLILFIFFNLATYSQNKNNEKKIVSRNVEVNVVTVVDTKFYKLLDSLIRYESRCSYYSDTLSYGIWIDKSLTDKGDSVIVVTFIGNSEKEIFIKGSHQQLLLGYFPYKKHKFFLFGRNILESVVITGKKETIKNCGNYYPSEDDRWAIYRFFYYNKNFTLYEKENDWLCK